MGHAEHHYRGEISPRHLQVLVVAPNQRHSWLEGLVRGQAIADSSDLGYCRSVSQAVSLAESQSFDLCFFDDRLGEAAVLRFLAFLRGLRAPFPVILIATPDKEELTAKVLQAGAADYLVRGQINHDLVLRSARFALERHQAQQERKSWQRRFRQLFDRSVVGIYRFSPDGRLLDCNEALVKILGYTSKEELLGRKLEEFLPSPGQQTTTAAESATTTAPGSVLRPFRERVFLSKEVCLKRRDGSFVWVRMTDGRLEGENGEPDSFEGTLVDISEQKRSDELLHQVEARYLTLFDAVGEGVMVLNQNGQIAASNRQAGALLGLRMSELVGRGFTDCFETSFTEQRTVVGDERLPPFVTLRTGEAVTGTLLGLRRLDGAEVWLRVQTAPVRGPGEEHPTSVILSMSNHSEAKRLQTQLVQAQKMEIVGRMAGGLSHDFRNLLTAISGYAELLQLETGLSEGARVGAQEIRRASKRAVDLVSNLVGFGRRQRPSTGETADPDQVITALKGVMTRAVGSRADLIIDLNLAQGIVPLNAGQLDQVVMNLVINACDALEDGGRLLLRTDLVEIETGVRAAKPSKTGLAGAAAEHLVEPGSYARLIVQDNGVGMDEETRRRIFDPVFTTKTPGKGTGLGLPTVYEIVRLVGGDVRVESQPETGTTVEVLLPWTPADRARSEFPGRV